MRTNHNPNPDELMAMRAILYIAIALITVHGCLWATW